MLAIFSRFLLTEGVVGHRVAAVSLGRDSGEVLRPEESEVLTAAGKWRLSPFAARMLE